MDVNLRDKPWAGYIENDLMELLEESRLLFESVSTWGEKFNDYSFVVFPAAKAYEGFLKKLFLDLKFISEEEYYGKRFRIGKALNPAIKGRLNGDSMYDKLVDYCRGKDLASKLWETWRECRNLVFHWFPNEKNAISLEEAEKRIFMIVDAIDAATRECKINY